MPVTTLNSVEDHVHILFELGRIHSISEAAKIAKNCSSRWIKDQDASVRDFAWQSGYGAFAVSASQVEIVTEYIANQAEHHRRVSFQDEYRELLQRHRVDFDERFVWA